MKKIRILATFLVVIGSDLQASNPLKPTVPKAVVSKHVRKTKGQKTPKEDRRRDPKTGRKLHADGELKKELRARYNKLYDKPLKAMEQEQLRALADVCIALEYFEEAIKVLEKFILTSKNLLLVKEARLEIADLYFEQGFFKTAGERYTEFVKLYPADKYVEYAQYKAILSFFECLPTSDRDQKVTEEVIAMADKLLEKNHPFKDDIQQLRDFCYRKLYEHHEGIFTHYCKKGSYDAATKRLAQIQALFDESKLSDIELRTLKLDYQLAYAQHDTKKLAVLEGKLALYPGFDAVKFASNQTKKSYVNFF